MPILIRLRPPARQRVLLPFRCITLDPPWHMVGGDRAPEHKYDVMKTDDITDLVLSQPVFRPAKHAHMYMWVVSNYLIDGLCMMRDLGFKFVTTVCWGKLTKDSTRVRFGSGQYFRGAHELCLFGVRGRGQHPSVMTVYKDIPSLLLKPHLLDAQGNRVHSAKPQGFYDLVERRTHGPYLEMFARSNRRGWTSFGNEVGKNDRLIYEAA